MTMLKALKKLFLLLPPLLICLLASCNGIFESFDSSGSDSECTEVLRGSVENPGKSGFGLQASKSSRTVAPAFSSDGLSYNVYASSGGGAAKISALSVDSSGNYTIAIKENGAYVIYAEVLKDSSVIYKGQSGSLKIENGKIKSGETFSTSVPAITARPLQSADGKGSVAIQIDASGTQTAKIKAEWKKSGADTSSSFEKACLSDTDRNFTFYMTADNSAGAVASGAYTLSLYFYSDTSCANEIYRIQDESVLVYDGLESKSVVKVTDASILSTVYVVGDSPVKLKENKNFENGKYYSPFTSIKSALDYLNTNSGDVLTLYLDGTFDNSASGEILVSYSSEKTVNIYGIDSSSKATITKSSGYGFNISEKATVNLKNVAVTNCSNSGIYFNSRNGTLNLENCEISGNTSNWGGGIYNYSGTVLITNCIITGNSATSTGGGIYNSGTCSISGGAISKNTADTGGGIYNPSSSSTLTIKGCTIDGNNSASSGGGICNSRGTLSLNDCQITGNTAVSVGGGIYKSGEGIITIENTRITGNKASSGGGLGYFTTLVSKGDINIAGEVYIFENTLSDGLTASNVLMGSSFKLSVSSVLSAESKIGISVNSGLVCGNSYKVTTGWNTYNSGTAAPAIFSSDDSKYSVMTNTDGEVSISNLISGTSVYVSKSGDDKNQGTKSSPLKTVNQAVKAINSVNDGVKEYTLYLLTDISANISGSGSFMDIEPDKNLNITIKPEDSTKLKIDAYRLKGGSDYKYRVMNAGANANVTLENLTLTGGYVEGADNGPGLYVFGNIKLIDCNVSGNKNSSTSNVGGGIYVAASGSVSFGGSTVINVEKQSNDVYLENDSSASPCITILKDFACSETYAARITMKSYTAGAQVLKAGDPSVDLSKIKDLFQITDNDTTDSVTWCIDDDGKLQKENEGTVYSSWSELASAVSSVTTNSSNSDFNVSYKITDISDFDNSAIALSGHSSDCKLAIVPTKDCSIFGNPITNNFFKYVNNVTATIGNENFSIIFGSTSVQSTSEFIYVDGNELSVLNCTFQNANANQAIDTNGTLLLKNCAFNKITASDGVINVRDGTTTIDTCEFEECSGKSIATSVTGKIKLQGTLSSAEIYIGNYNQNGTVILDKNLIIADDAILLITIKGYNSSVKLFASDDGGEISETFRNNPNLSVSDDDGNEYTINADGTLSIIDNSELSTFYTDAKTVLKIPSGGSTYKISSENDLIYLNTLVEAGNELTGATFLQTKDIVISNSWDPIGSQLKAFKGTYDGNSYSVTNLNYDGDDYCAGFFAYVVDATIKNLTVSGKISTKDQWAGGIVGYIDGSSNTTIDNCVSSVAVTSSKGYAGGIVGAYKVSSGSLVISNCYNTGTIACDATSSVLGYGGIIGYTGTAGTVTVKNCVNTGVVGGDYAKGVGGIIGNGDGTRSLENCATTGSIIYDKSSNETHGAISGSNNNALTLIHTYYKVGIDSYGRAYIPGTSSPTEDSSGTVISFSSAGILSQPESVNSSSYNDVVSALNAWVSANGSDKYRTWSGENLGL